MINKALRQDRSSNYSKRNYLIGVNNGILVEINKSLINPHLVLAAFVFSKTGSTLLVGLLTALNSVGAFLPQLYVSSLTEHRNRKKPFIIHAVATRILVMIFLIGLIWFSSFNDDLLVIIFFIIVFFIYRLFRGAEFIVFWDFFGGAIPSGRLGGFVANRSLFKGIAAMLTGVLIVQPVLNSFSEDRSYLILSLIALFILIIDLVQLTFVEEEANRKPPEKRSFVKTVSGSACYLKESSNYRKLIVIRMFHRINMLTFAFLIPYAYERIGIIGMAGLFLSIIETSKFSSSVVWGRLSYLLGNRKVLAAGNFFFFLSALLILCSSFIPSLFCIDIFFLNDPLDFSMLIFLISIVFAGFAQQANMVSFKAFVIESAPQDRRSSNLAFINTVTVPFAFIAPVVGLAVENNPAQYNSFYLMLAISGLLSSVISYSLKEV